MSNNHITVSPLLTKSVNNLRQLIQNKCPAYIEILDKNIHGTLTIEDPHDSKDAQGNYKPVGKRRRIYTELSLSKLKSIEILLNKALPDLKVSEHRDVSPMEQIPEGDLVARLKLILAQRPELAQKLFDEQTVPVEAKRVDHKESAA